MIGGGYLKKIKCFFKYLGVSVIILILLGLFFPTWTPSIKGENSISVLEQIEINGTKHEIMIRGQDKSNPILIFVHGGPGCSEIPYVTKYQDLLEKDFTIVHYDQRGSGKSYHFFEDYSNLSSELLVNDLLAITDYISGRFGKEQVLLAGHSFGTYIALQAANKAPEKYSAYIGIGQMSNTIQSESDTLRYCIEQAESAGNENDIATLKGLTSKIEQGKILTPRDIVRKYGGASRLINDNGDYIEGFLLHPEYNLLDVIRYSCGIRVSQDVLFAESINNPLSKTVTSLKVPCYFIMGQYDYMTSSESAKSYLNLIDADKKEFISYSNSAHYPQFEEKDKFARWLIDNFANKVK
jgi:pimeloyl-ACP methyl ester carboxylesterase